MRRYAPLLLLGTAYMAEAAEQKDRCQPDLITEVSLIISPEGSVYVPATIGDKEVYFDLMLGSGLPIIAGSAVETLGLKKRTISGHGEMKAGGTRVTHYADLQELKIGAYKLLPRAAPIIPQPGIGNPRMIEGKPYAGRMGSTFMRRVDVEFVLAEKKMRIFRKFRCQGRSPAYWGGEVAEIPMRYDDAEAIVFNLELNGKPVESGLLSGRVASTIDTRVTREFFGFDETSPGASAAPAREGSSTSEKFHPMSLTGKGLRIKDAAIAMLPASPCKLTGARVNHGGIGYSDCVSLVPFNLGVDLLSRMRIYISSEREKVYMSTIGGDAGSDSGTITVTTAQ